MSGTLFSSSLAAMAERNSQRRITKERLSALEPAGKKPKIAESAASSSKSRSNRGSKKKDDKDPPAARRSSRLAETPAASAVPEQNEQIGMDEDDSEANWSSAASTNQELEELKAVVQSMAKLLLTNTRAIAENSSVVTNVYLVDEAIGKPVREQTKLHYELMSTKTQQGKARKRPPHLVAVEALLASVDKVCKNANPSDTPDMKFVKQRYTERLQNYVQKVNEIKQADQWRWTAAHLRKCKITETYLPRHLQNQRPSQYKIEISIMDQVELPKVVVDLRSSLYEVLQQGLSADRRYGTAPRGPREREIATYLDSCSSSK